MGTLLANGAFKQLHKLKAVRSDSLGGGGGVVQRIQKLYFSFIKIAASTL